MSRSTAVIFYKEQPEPKLSTSSVLMYISSWLGVFPQVLTAQTLFMQLERTKRLKQEPEE